MSWEAEKEILGKEIIGMLYEQGMIKTWYRDKPEGWTLVSGIWSPFYIQLRPLSSYPNSKEILAKVGIAIGNLIENEAPYINKLVGVAAAGIPIAITATIHSGIPSCYTRKLEGVRNVTDLENRIQAYGEHSLMEGEINNGDNIAIVDDLVTKFDTKLIAIEQVRYEVRRRERQTGEKINFQCKDVIVLFDREQGAQERAEELGINLYSIIPFKSKGLSWLRDKISDMEYKIMKEYLENSKKYQDKKVRSELRDAAIKKGELKS